MVKKIVLITNLQNPKDPSVCLKFLIHLSVTDTESDQNIKFIIKKYLGHDFNKYLNDIVLKPDDSEKNIDIRNKKHKLGNVELSKKLRTTTKDSFIKLKTEDEKTKIEIIIMFEEIIFADHEVFPSERRFYDMAKKYLEIENYDINPTVELFEYLHVLNYVSASDFANFEEFYEIWIKYMGPDISVYYNEALQNLNDLSLEEQIQRIGSSLELLNKIDDEKTSY